MAGGTWSAFATHERQREQQTAGFAFMATHSVPTVSEYSSSWFSAGADRRASRRQLLAMQATVQNALKSPDTAGPTSAVEAGYTIAIASEARTPKDGEVIVAAKTATAVKVVNDQPVPAYATQALSDGALNRGDIDVFWNAGPGQVARYARGQMVSFRLATFANPDQQFGPGVPVGRVRLSRLPQAQQRAGEQYYSGFDAVVIDAGTGEAEAAAALPRRIGELGRDFVLRDVKGRGAFKRWYLGVFLCAGVAPSSAAPADASMSPLPRAGGAS